MTTKTTKKLPWLRLYTDFIDDPKVQLLAFEDQRHFIAVLCLKRAGVLEAEYSSDELRDRIIAKKLGLSHAAADEAKRRLYEVDLIDNDWQPTGWDKRQFDSDHSGAERTRRYRERHSNVTVTSRRDKSDVPDTDKDTDADTERLRSSSEVALATSSSERARRTANKAEENRRKLAAVAATAVRGIP